MRGKRVIAHRGFADQYPENTVTSVVESIGRADMVEVDVRPCATGELVVFHDETLDRLTDATGAVAEQPLSRLRELDVGGSGEPIPTLPELLAAVPDGPRVNLELKTTRPDAVARAINVCERHGVDVLYSSFHDGAVRTVRELRPGAALAVLAHRGHAIGDRLGLASELGAVAFHPSVALVEGWTGAPTDTDSLDVSVDVEDDTVTVDADIVALAHGLGLRVNAWTAPNHDAVRRLFDRGVDGVMIDHPEDVPREMAARSRRRPSVE